MLDLRAINQRDFARAKIFWTIANALRGIIFIAGAWAVFIANPSVYLPLLLFGLVVVAELCQWHSDSWKGHADSLLRKLDLCRSFGREMTRGDLREIASRLPASLRKSTETARRPDEYFTTSAPQGTQAAVENLVESAWYTMKQARYMVGLFWFLGVVIVGTGLAALIVSSNEVHSLATRNDVSKVVTSWLLLIFSLGIFRNGWAYYKLFRRSEESYNVASRLTDTDVDDNKALAHWYEYQIVRASAPLLPSWLWHLKQRALNEAWRIASAG